MAYLLTFHWGWLLASLLLGLAMGWIAVVQRGDGVSRMVARWLAALAAALVAASIARIRTALPPFALGPRLCPRDILVDAPFACGPTQNHVSRANIVAIDAKEIRSRWIRAKDRVSIELGKLRCRRHRLVEGDIGRYRLRG